MYTLQRSKSHGFGVMHFKDNIIIIIQTEIKNIMLMVTQNVSSMCLFESLKISTFCGSF